MLSSNCRVAIVGATGAVGEEVIKLLEERYFPLESLTLFASARSAGSYMAFKDAKLEVFELQEDSFADMDLVIFATPSEVSRRLVPLARAAGCICIDNSSAFRMDPEVPLVIPEINPGALKNHQGIIANPNCTTAITLMALYPLHLRFGVVRIFASSYQAVSGAGEQGIEELQRQTMLWSQNKGAGEIKVFPHPIAFNVIPQVEKFMDSGYTDEEEKMQREGAKIMELPDFKASMTCVRVPVFRAHSIAVSAEFEQPVSVSEALKALREMVGLEVINQELDLYYPTPLNAEGNDDCSVGRIRKDSALENGLSFFVVGDQLRKGAALNAVQIAEHLLP